MRTPLEHVYWIGGGSGAGKSTIARRVAAQHGMRVYSTDEAMSDHARRSASEDAPFLSEFKAMDMDQRWVNRSAQTMLETFHWFRGEGFTLIVEDLLRLPAKPGVPRSAAGAHCGISRGRPAIRRRPSATCSSATGCSQIA